MDLSRYDTGHRVLWEPVADGAGVVRSILASVQVQDLDGKAFTLPPRLLTQEEIDLACSGLKGMEEVTQALCHEAYAHLLVSCEPAADEVEAAADDREVPGLEHDSEFGFEEDEDEDGIQTE